MRTEPLEREGATIFPWFQYADHALPLKSSQPANSVRCGRWVIMISEKLIQGQTSASLFLSQGRLRSRPKALGIPTWDCATGFSERRCRVTLYIPTLLMPRGDSGPKTPLLHSMQADVQAVFEKLSPVTYIQEGDFPMLVEQIFSDWAKENILQRRSVLPKQDSVWRPCLEGRRWTTIYFCMELSGSPCQRFIWKVNEKCWRPKFNTRLLLKQLQLSMWLAPVYPHTDQCLAVDHNQMVMERHWNQIAGHLRTIPASHLAVAGINGSGKHICSSDIWPPDDESIKWSRKPHEDIQFLPGSGLTIIQSNLRYSLPNLLGRIGSGFQQ